MIRGQVFWVSFNGSVGGEIKKTRPAVVVSNDSANGVLNRVIVVPLTSNRDHVYAGETLVHVGGRVQKALGSQMTTVSKLRIGDLFGELSRHDAFRLDAELLIQLGMKIRGSHYE